MHEITTEMRQVGEVFMRVSFESERGVKLIGTTSHYATADLN